MSDTYSADFSAAEDSGISSDGFDGSEVDLGSENTLGEDSSTEIFDGFTEESTADPIFEIDGKGITLDEARNGYLRQSDYTKKTQEISEMRQRLADAEAIAEALRSDPSGTLAALSDAFGVNLGGEDPYSSFEDLDPDEQRIAILEQKIAAQEQAATQAAIQAELESIRDQYGDFDESSLFAHAIKGNFPNLRSAYADLNFNTIQSRLAELETKKQTEEKRIAAKREAANTIHNGTGRSGSVDPTGDQKFGSLRDAYLAAKKSLGV